ncbi:hypothetical protein FNV43_RR15973 [Rhamnella rubrinervis]|uniref:Ribosomal protein S24e family protein n=1 Tax=Rhamnella rubrinervis TaxID=2594499 RepID=A0A8K0EDE5_9ROSA|nr:hypothetical protein FNV43_RR15973 [Rhamnella rubrinervis]
MSRLTLLRTAIRSNFCLRIPRADNNGLPSLLLRESPRCFSTETESGQKTSADSLVDSLMETQKTGLVYGKLYGRITRNTLKTDIVNMLEGCNLRLEDVRVDYNRSFSPIAMMVQFPSPQAYDKALRAVRSRPLRLDRADRSQWDLLTPYDGRTVLLQGIPRNALPEDVERFLCGCEYDATSISMFLRAAYADPIRMATVRFPTHNEAMNAFIRKNNAFCLNNQITVRVLQ